MSDHMLTEEELLLRNTVRDFVDERVAPRAADYDEAGAFPWDNFRDLAELGLFGLTIGEEFGGQGGTARQSALVVEELARGCASTAVIYVAHLSLCTRLIDLYGTEGQKQRFIPPLVSGQKMGAFALTEPGAGSDAGAISTTATKSNGGYVLNGTKLFSTNAPEADTFIIMASMDRSLRTRGINALIVERDTRGMTITPQHGKMGMRASSTAEIVFDDSPVPGENRLGPEGLGFRQAMEGLNASRIEIAAQALGIAQAAYESAVSYAQQRKAFGQRIADFQGIQWMIVEMATNIEAARHLVYNAAAMKDKGLPFVKEASMAKLYASRAAVEASDKAVQIHGATGYFAPTPAERYYRDAKATEIYEGSSEIQRLIIARNILDSM